MVIENISQIKNTESFVDILSSNLQISNENSEDITEIILPYLGPENNWHGANLTPNILGYKSLIFQLADSNERQYSYDDIIDSF